MKIIHNKTNIRGEFFFAPVAVAQQQSKYTRNCHGYTDLQHLVSGIGPRRCCQFIRRIVDCLEDLTSWSAAVNDLRLLMTKLL